MPRCQVLSELACLSAVKSNVNGAKLLGCRVCHQFPCVLYLQDLSSTTPWAAITPQFGTFSGAAAGRRRLAAVTAPRPPSLAESATIDIDLTARAPHLALDFVTRPCRPVAWIFCQRAIPHLFPVPMSGRPIDYRR